MFPSLLHTFLLSFLSIFLFCTNGYFLSLSLILFVSKNLIFSLLFLLYRSIVFQFICIFSLFSLPALIIWLIFFPEMLAELPSLCLVSDHHKCNVAVVNNVICVEDSREIHSFFILPPKWTSSSWLVIMLVLCRTGNQTAESPAKVVHLRMSMCNLMWQIQIHFLKKWDLKLTQKSILISINSHWQLGS